MSPTTQVLDDPDREGKVESTSKVPEIHDDMKLKCTSNFEDNTFDVENLVDQETPTEVESEEVDVTGCLNTSDNRFVEHDDPDATEYSSSFGDTLSRDDDGSRMSDAEVSSCPDGDNGFCYNPFEQFDSLFPRKKKLTTHWRKYIHPLMWRCKWIELRIKELQSQSIKYGRELAAYDQQKQLELGQYASEDCVRSIPFLRQNNRNKVMRRRKRKRIEDTADIPSYMFIHKLFSYYEKKKPDAYGALDEDCGNQVTAEDGKSNNDFDDNLEWTSVDFKDSDDSLEQILWKVEIAQAKVQKLTGQIEKLLAINAGKFCSMDNISDLALTDLPNSSSRSPTSSPGNAETMPVGAFYNPPQHISQTLVDMVRQESAVSSIGEAIPLPDLIESTKLPIIEDQPQLLDKVLIHSRTDNKDLPPCEKVHTLPVEKPQEASNEKQRKASGATTPSVQDTKTEPTEETILAQEQSALKLPLSSEVNVPKTKRKRGERKAGSGGWNAEKISRVRRSGKAAKKD